MDEQKKRTPIEFIAASSKPEPFKIPDPEDRAKSISLGGDGGDIIDSIISHGEDDFLPWEEVQLPSLGYYNPDLPEGKVEVRPMGITAEKILSTPRLAASGRAIDLMIKRCVKFPDGFNMDMLLTGDKNFLFYYIRGITFGADYEFLYACSERSCGIMNTFYGDLRDIEVQYVDPDMGPEPFRVVLPVFSELASTEDNPHEVWAKIRFLRSGDTREIAQQIKTSRFDESLDATIDEAIVDNISRLIVAVGSDDSEGTQDPQKIEAMVDRMHSKDVKILDRFITKRSPGINTRVKMVCNHCGNEMQGDLPLTESFFRPS